MVYTAALLFGHGLSALTAEDGGGSSGGGMFGKYLSQRPAPRSGSARRGSVESCEESDTNPLFGDPEAGQESDLRLLQQYVIGQMERRLTEAKASTLHCQALLLPRHLTGRIGRDVLRASADEPCGLRGAAIKIYVEGKDGLTAAGSVAPDPSVTPTFELSVILRVEREGGWPPFSAIFDSGKVLKLRPEYRLVKRKLYSSASPVVHEFS